MISLLRKWAVRRKLAKTMKPAPQYRERRLAQFSKKRKARYWRNVACIRETV